MIDWLTHVARIPSSRETLRALALAELWEAPLAEELIAAAGRLALSHGGDIDVRFRTPMTGDEPLLVSQVTRATDVATWIPQYIHHVLVRTQVRTPTLMVAVIYLDRISTHMTKRLYAKSGVSRYRLFLAALRVAAVELADVSPDYPDWTSCVDWAGGTNAMERQLTTLLGFDTSVTELELSDCYHSLVPRHASRAHSHLAPPCENRTVLSLDPLADVLPLLAAARPCPSLQKHSNSPTPFVPCYTDSVLPPTVPNPGGSRWWAQPKLVPNPTAAPPESRSREGGLKRSRKVPQSLSKLIAPTPAKLVENAAGSASMPGEFGEWVAV